MKELSIEEKAKAYDEAKLRMSAAYNSNRCTIGFMNEIFPELAKSEGEQSKNWILEYLYDGLRKSDEQFKDHFKAAIAWLEKQGEQKLAEWSEEDEKMLDFAITVITASTATTFKKEDCVDWLKSFRPQSQWKPSQEQMIALKCAITTADEKWVCMNTKDLESLYEQLKKLRED